MAITEQGRHDMYNALEAAIGKEPAAMLMEHLPPVGWADVATKRDLDHLRTDIDAVVRVEIERLRTELHRSLRTQLVTFLAANTAIVTVVLGVLGR